MLWPADAHAQAGRRTPSHGGGGGRVYSSGVSGRPIVVSPRAVYYRPYYYRPYFYDPFFWGSYGWGPGWGLGFGYGYGWGWGGYGYPYYGYPGYGYYGYRNYSSARIQVTPKEAKVYVDGFYAGVVDDFDGWSQRLDVPPGQHEVEIYLEGFRTLRERVLFQPGETVKIKGTLEKLGPGQPPEPPPQPVQPPPQQQTANPNQPNQPGPYGQYGGSAGPGAPSSGTAPYGPYGRPSRRAPQPQAQVRPSDPSEFGTLSVRVQPRDAEVYVDGEQWQTPDDQPGFSIQLTPGRHRVEVKKSGFRAYTAEVDIQPGDLTPLNVSLLSAHENEN